MEGELGNTCRIGGLLRNVAPLVGSHMSRAVPVVTSATFVLAYTASGATFAFLFLALVGFFVLRSRTVKPSLLHTGAWFIVLYVLIVVIDFANGDIGESIGTTVVAYLPLLGILPAAAAMAQFGMCGISADRKLAASILIGSIVNGILFLQADVPRAGGLGTSPIDFGFVILSWAMLALARALDNWPHRAWLFWPVLLSFLPIALSATKMLLVCTFVGFGIILMQLLLQQRLWSLIIPFTATLVLLSLGTAQAFSVRWKLLKEHIQYFIEKGDLAPGSFGVRLEMIRLGIAAFRDAPLIGHGRSNQVQAAMEHATPQSLDLSHYNTLHNDYLVHLVSFGLFGMLFVISFLCLLIHISRGIADPAMRSFGLAWTVMLAVFMLTNVAFNSGPMSGPVCFVAALLLAARDRPSKPT